ncbi:MAG: rhodanese-related sulfurtransferase [Candidatus Woesearchaeota archaeon]|jgi:rhodanese-related sulfurtransferase
MIIDVLPSDSYAQTHIKDAVNFSVSKIDFADDIQKSIPKDTEIVVYGWNNASSEAIRAQTILKSLGYKSVEILNGGLQKWINDKKDIVTTQ